jgi:glycosyltransferase involved in cell wall biosynthesis
MPSFTASVVIPTFNRLDTLPEVLAALAAQNGTPTFETIVVDDGSSDGTAAYLADPTEPTPADLTVLTQPNRGPAAARNAGVAAARGDIVAFLGDDTVPSPGWLGAHLEARERRVSEGAEDRLLAVIGYTGWHPRMRINPFLRYVNEYGLQFGYAIIEDPEDVPFNFFYTSNLSLPRELLLAEPFDVEFPYPAWEDVEAGYRMSRRGMRLVYAPRATTAHDHPTTIERFAERQEKAGYSAVVFHRRHPELGAFLGLGADGPPPLPPARRQRWLERVVRTLQSLPVKLPHWWEEVLRYHYIRGLRRGWREIEDAGLADDGGRPQNGDRHEATAH